jgi:DDE superfamily endonuclease
MDGGRVGGRAAGAPRTDRWSDCPGGATPTGVGLPARAAGQCGSQERLAAGRARRRGHAGWDAAAAGHRQQPVGRAFIDRELYLPRTWTEDPDRCRAARVPQEVGFRTKPQLARLTLQRSLDASVPVSWVTADEAYGGDQALRRFLEERGLSYVLAVKCTEPLAIPGPDGPVQAAAEQLAAAVPAERWVTVSAGHGAKGRRLYDWTRVELTPAAAAGTTGWLGPAGRSRRASSRPKARSAGGAGLVTMAPTPPGPSATRTLPAT